MFRPVRAKWPFRTAEHLPAKRGAEDEILPAARALGIGVVAYSPLGRGFLTGGIKRFEDFAEDDLAKHIPGNPTVVSQYMPGGGGRKAANHIYSSVRSDGLTIGSVASGLLTAAAFGAEGVSYDLSKFIYLGAPTTGGRWLFVTRKKSLSGLWRSCAPRAGCASAHSRSDITFIR